MSNLIDTINFEHQQQPQGEHHKQIITLTINLETPAIVCSNPSVDR